MPIHNTEIAEIFEQMADLLDLQEANQFRIRAYRNAANTISSLSRNATDLVKEGEDLSELPGIGKDLAGKIEEIVKTGTFKQLQELQKKTPPELAELMNISELGPKRVIALHKKLGIKNKRELKEAAEAEKIRALEGFGEKTERNILEALKRQEEGAGKDRIKLNVAEELTRPLLEYLRQIKGVKKVEAAGSYRRKKETVGDLDILVTCEKSAAVMEQFVNYEDVRKVISKGETRSSGLIALQFSSRSAAGAGSELRCCATLFHREQSAQHRGAKIRSEAQSQGQRIRRLQRRRARRRQDRRRGV